MKRYEIEEGKMKLSHGGHYIEYDGYHQSLSYSKHRHSMLLNELLHERTVVAMYKARCRSLTIMVYSLLSIASVLALILHTEL
jgi:hypothetical protein